MAAVVYGHFLKLCYVDESGGFEPEGSGPTVTPLMVIAGLIVDHRNMAGLTRDYMRVKQTYYPHALSQVPHLLSYILVEVKSTDMRRQLRSKSREERRHVIGYLDKVVTMLEQHKARIIGRVWVKAPGFGLNPASTYTYAIQDMARHFEHSLAAARQTGLMVCDSRMHGQDKEVSHSVFTQKHRQAGDAFPHLVESPTFGVSNNHAGLQLADLLAGGLLFPMACRVYCEGSSPVHTNPRFDRLRERYAVRLQRLQYTYTTATGRSAGGIVVSDKRGKRPSQLLFRLPAAPVTGARPADATSGSQ
ncbi:MAG TPA: DUF3800 domain-containing protein [Candidatus Dormibacteraeota bacterium]